MGDSVERALEETVPILRTAHRLKLLTQEETSTVVRKRRDHEYAVLSRNATRATFLRYAAFERTLAEALSVRAKKRHVKKKKAQLVVGRSAARVNLVYSRAVRRFPGDADLWLHYARHCIRTGSTRAAAKVFAKAISFCGGDENVWLAAFAFQFDTCGDAVGARAIAQRALRALPEAVTIWTEYFRMEVCYLAKLISRRLILGLHIGTNTKRKVPIENKPKKPAKKSNQSKKRVSTQISKKGKRRKRKNISTKETQPQHAQEGEHVNLIHPTPTGVAQEETLSAHQKSANNSPTLDNADKDVAAGLDDGGNAEHSDGDDESIDNEGSDEESEDVDDDALDLPGAEPVEDQSEGYPPAKSSDDPVSSGKDSKVGTDSDSSCERGTGALGARGRALAFDDDSEDGTSAVEEEQGKFDAESTEIRGEAHDAKRALSFWEGGVPMAVFNNASKRCILSFQQRVEFWDIAASTPFVPVRLLEDLSTRMLEKFPDCLICHLVKDRMPWDVMHARSLEQKTRENGRRPNSYLEGIEVQPPGVETQNRDLVAKALLVVEDMKRSLSGSPLTLDGKLKASIFSFLTSFETSVSSLSESGNLRAEVNALRAFVSRGLREKEPKMSVEETLKTLGSLSGQAVLEILESEEEISSAQDGQLYDAIKHDILVPFRGIDQERALCSWIAREADLERLRELSKQIYGLPPLTMESIRGLIDAEIRIWRQLENSGKASKKLTDDMISHTRKCFKVASSLPAAKRDIEMWLIFVDFERNIARDSKQATMASWKAMKALDEKSREIFTERQTLRNLMQ